ncbi:MAG TPA: GNAT family N-acetyltransferase [Candidatus Methylomirabilis sp.]|nr:GNAT family N-acetyltransferase [Candidatus Methylomirabilis sp.]
MKIRKAKIEDAAAMSRLVKRTIVKINGPYYTKRQILAWKKLVSARGYRKRIKDGNRYLVVAEKKEMIVGVGIMNPKKQMISGMYVRVENIRQGIGQKLISALEKRLMSLPVNKISLNSSLSAVKFYQCMGYEKIKKTFTIMNGERIPCVLMIKKF